MPKSKRRRTSIVEPSRYLGPSHNYTHKLTGQRYTASRWANSTKKWWELSHNLGLVDGFWTGKIVGKYPRLKAVESAIQDHAPTAPKVQGSDFDALAVYLDPGEHLGWHG